MADACSATYHAASRRRRTRPTAPGTRQAPASTPRQPLDAGAAGVGGHRAGLGEVDAGEEAAVVAGDDDGLAVGREGHALRALGYGYQGLAPQVGGIDHPGQSAGVAGGDEV